MKRWHQDVHKMKKEAKIDQTPWLEPEMRRGPLPLGRYRKKHALDCGKTRCGICHFDKYYGKRAQDNYIADLNMQEQLKEVDN